MSTSHSEPETPIDKLVQRCKDMGWVKYRPDNPYVLASGKKSPYYYDMRSALLDGEFLRTAEEPLIGLIEGMDIPADVIGGMDVAARPLVSFISYLFQMPGFVLRKEVKGHGLENKVDGQPPEKGQGVLIVEDVVTTGGSAKKVADYIESCGAETVGLLTILDRSGPLDWIPVIGCLFTPQHFFPELT